MGNARDRFNRRNDLKRRDRRGRIKRFSQTPVGQLTTELFLGSLADYLDSKLEIKPPPPPSDELNERLGRLKDPYPAVALAILSPLLDNIMRGWAGMDDPAAEARLAENMGKNLCDWLALQDLRYSDSKTDRRLFNAIRRRGRKLAWKHLQSEWSPPECVAAGIWMIGCAGAMPYFTIDDRGFPAIAPEWQGAIDRIRADILSRYLAMMPHLTPPPDWTGWWATYDDRPRQPFVRDWRPETRTAIEATFAAAKPFDDKSPFAALGYSLPFAHADGVNALQRVPLRINKAIVPLVEKFAERIMITTDDKSEADKQREANRVTVEDDLKDARWIGDQHFFLSYNCDKRGRINAIPRLNYQREDHVRALFEFANGLPLGDGLQWLQIHCANCEGSTDKERWTERLHWVNTNRDRIIKRIAADPEGTFDLWRGVDKPFAFVAACLELVKAENDPVGFVTHLPIGFDGSANGLQHLALLARDEGAAELTNLIGFDVGSVRYPSEAEYRRLPTPGQRAIRYRQAGEALVAALKVKDAEEPRDVYDVIARRVVVALSNQDNEVARAWCTNLRLLNGRLRKLFKGAIMIYPYSGTDAGMADKIMEAHADMQLNCKLQRSAALFLAKTLRQMCDEVLPGPARIMNYIRDLADYRLKQKLVLEWRGGTGFAVANRYQHSRIELVELTLEGVRVRHEVADGAIADKFDTTKTRNSASPNFIHSLDAAHLIRVVLAAIAADIKDILTVHDSFACLAPHAARFGQLIRRELLLLHLADPLANLRRANIGDPEAAPPPPELGGLNIFKLQYGEYSFA